MAYASRALTEDESLYAQVEKELLAATFTCKKFHDFIYGREAIIDTDHKPITAIVNKASLFILHCSSAKYAVTASEVQFEVHLQKRNGASCTGCIVKSLHY